LNIIELGVSYSIVEFPKSIQDPHYLWEILRQTEDIEYHDFITAWNKVVDPKLLRF
jgi:hypothetical protein